METTTGIDKPSTNRSKARVTRACDACKGRKIRCTGAQPCAHCIKYKKVCEYKAEHGRGNPPPPKKASEEEQQAYLAGYGWPVASKNDTSSSSNAETVEQIVGNEGQMNFAPENDDYRPFEDTPDRIHRDIPLHQRGQSTESAVYESSQNNMNHRLAHHQKSSIFAYGDPPVPEIVTSFMALPSVTRAYELVDQFFEFTSGIHRVLHRQTTLTWTKNLLNSPGSYHNDADENSQRAVVLVVFATVHTFLSHETKDATADLSLQYFLAAEQQLKDETGSVKITTIQARLLQILYLLSRSRIHQAYSIFCTVIGLTFTLGIHRGYNHISEDDPLQIDCQRRVFWGIYLVDKYLSSALGRPQLLRDEDIDQTLPVMIDDEGLSPGIFMLTGNQGIMKAAIFHIKLTQIIARILSSLYTISKPPLETRYSLARSLALQLDAWRNGDIKPFLDLSPDTLDPLFQRQHLALHLAYGQAQIILYRPFLLEDRRESTEGERLVKNCLDASMNIIGIIDSMYEVQETFATSWFAHFCAYNAVVALYVYVIKATSSRSLTQPWKLYFEVASRCQDQIKTSSETESFAQKCSVVLEELRFEALGHIRNDGGQDGTPNGGIDGIGSGIPEAGGRTNSSSYFGGRWNDMTFDQGAPGGGILGSLFGNVDGIHVRSGTGSVVERIDQWGFSSLTGY